MAEHLDVRIAGEPMRLLADRALYWPARRRLFIADLHLGKGDTFRSAGITLPSGGTAHDLARITRLIERSSATSLWVLGDFLHAAATERSWRAGWNAWRAQHSDFAFGVLAGNHDRALATAGLDLSLLGNAVDDAPFALRHAPDARTGLHVLCGHLHPTVKIADVPRRWPAFWLRERLTVLPAFSQFTGGRTPALMRGERLVACVENDVLAIPAHLP